MQSTVYFWSLFSPVDNFLTLGHLETPKTPSDFHFGSPIRTPTLPPTPAEVDEQLKQEIAEDVYKSMSQYSAFRLVYILLSG